MLVTSFLSPLLIPLVAASGAPAELKAVMSGLLALGIPELGMLAAVAILGKAGYQEIKRQIFGFIKRHGPPDTVSPIRYRFGLVMFCGPLVFAVVQPYAEYTLAETTIGHILAANRFFAALSGDIIFALSFIVLGGDFWDKVRALFVQGVEVASRNNSRMTDESQQQ